MIKVRYSEDEKGFIHNIDIKKVERLANDGTFLIRGKENGYNVILHVMVDPLGNFYKIPHTSKEYIKLMLPFIKKVDVTKSLKPQLDGLEIDTMKTEKKSNKTIKMFYHPEFKKMYISLNTAYELGYIKNPSNSTDDYIIDRDTNVDEKYFEINNITYEQIKDKYHIEVVRFEIIEKKKDDSNSYIESRTAKLLMDLKYYLTQKGSVDDDVRKMITWIINREKVVANYPKDEYKEELQLLLYYDLEDLINTARGLNLSDDRVKNYGQKVESFNNILTMREDFLDLSIVREVLQDIQEKVDEAFKLNNAIDPNTWMLIETFTNELVDALMIVDFDEFRKKISTFNKNNMLYSQIIYQLNNYIEGKNNTR